MTAIVIASHTEGSPINRIEYHRFESLQEGRRIRDVYTLLYGGLKDLHLNRAASDRREFMMNFLDIL